MNSWFALRRNTPQPFLSPSPSQYPSRNPCIISFDDVTTRGNLKAFVLLLEPVSGMPSHRQSFSPACRDTTLTLNIERVLFKKPEGTRTGCTCGTSGGNASANIAWYFRAN